LGCDAYGGVRCARKASTWNVWDTHVLIILQNYYVDVLDESEEMAAAALSTRLVRGFLRRITLIIFNFKNLFASTEPISGNHFFHPGGSFLY
jgi:hypothetical protein